MQIWEKDQEHGAHKAPEIGPKNDVQPAVNRQPGDRREDS